MPAASAHRRPIRERVITAAAYERICATVGPSELERGRVIRMMAGGLEHSGAVNEIAYLLTRWARRTGLGRVYSGEAGIVTSSDPDTVRGVDVAYFLYKRLPRGKQPQGFSRTPPSLAVEVVGKGQGWNKMLEKAAEYLQMGVDRVWIADPKSRSVYVLRPDAGPELLRERQYISDPIVLPGFRARVRGLFDG